METMKNLKNAAKCYTKRSLYGRIFSTEDMNFLQGDW